MINKNKLLDKCEAMTLLCTNASTHWSFVKFCFNIPLVLTSSTMCIINSISENANDIKIPNIVVNAVSVLNNSNMHKYRPDCSGLSLSSSVFFSYHRSARSASSGSDCFVLFFQLSRSNPASLSSILAK